MGKHKKGKLKRSSDGTDSDSSGAEWFGLQRLALVYFCILFWAPCCSDLQTNPPRSATKKTKKKSRISGKRGTRRSGC